MARITNIKDLLFHVELCPVFTEIEIEGKTLRIEVPQNRIVINSISRKPLGVVSNNYKLITNLEAVELGQKCARELFGSAEAENIEIFNVDAPSTASYCHIDLVHKNYIMNLWDENKQSEIYVPYIRITNSYNTSRALRFDIGFCRKICFNGVIFESETITFTFSHIKQELNNEISFVLEQDKIKKLFDRFIAYAKRLQTFLITQDRSMSLILALFGIKAKEEIDFSYKKEDESEYDSLIEKISNRISDYVREFGGSAYSLFNVITDMASHPIENRYFRRDINSMQRLAGHWINSFQKGIQNQNFDIDCYIDLLKTSPDKALGLSGNRYAAARR